LARRLLAGPQANGYPTDLWTCPRIAELIRQQYGVRYHVDSIGRLLRRLDFSPQRPIKQAAERDEAVIRHWIEMDWPRIKKTPPVGTPA
jgi:transposase